MANNDATLVTTIEVELDVDDHLFTVHVNENGKDVEAVAKAFCQENNLPTDKEAISQISDSLRGALEEHLQESKDSMDTSDEQVPTKGKTKNDPNPNPIPANPNGSFTCSDCGTEKDKNSFSRNQVNRHTFKKDGVLVIRSNPKCKECVVVGQAENDGKQAFPKK